MTLAVNTYKAQLNYHDSSWGWGNEGTASQGKWDGTGNRTGVLYFPGLAALKGKIINKVSLTVTAKDAGNGAWADKTARFYRSANQGGIKTSLGASHKTGSQIGSITGSMYDNTTSYTPSFLGSYIASGDDTFCLYDGSNTGSYFKWTAVTLTVDWSEPATQPTLSASSVELGQPVTITTAATNSAYRHKLRYSFGSASGTIAENVEGSCSWTPPVSLASQIPNATSGIGTIYCDTYSGTTLLGTKSVGVTLTVPSSVKPTAGTLSAAVTGDTSGTGLYVKGMGKAKLTLSGAAGTYGSTIKSYQITGGGWSAAASTLTTGILATAGEITFTGKVTDSRGRTSDNVTCKITVVDYSRPGVSTWTVYRCDADGNKKNAGTYAAVEINADFSAITGNTLTLKAAYKLATETDYGEAVDLTNNGKTVIGGGNLSAAKTYDVRITVSDRYNTITIPTKLSTKKVICSIFPKGLGFAIGKVAELAGWLDVAWHLRVRKDLQVDGATTLATALGIVSGGTGEKSRYGAINGLIYLGANPVTSDTDTTAYWGQTLGNGVAMFSQTGCVADQPSQYGLVLNCCVKGSSEVHQIWLTQSTGAMYHRGGNSSGWNGSWRKVLDNTMTIPVSGGGTDATTAAGARANLGIDTSVLYSGSLSSGSASFTFGSHKAFIVVGRPAGSAASVALVIPAKFFNSVARSMQLADNVDFLKFTITHTDASGSLTITQNDDSGAILAIYGVN